MTRFVVETYVPSADRESFELAVESIRAAADMLAELGTHVRHVRSTFVPGDEMGFLEVEAVSREEVAHLTRQAGIEVERIVEVIGVGPDGTTDELTEGPR